MQVMPVTKEWVFRKAPPPTPTPSTPHTPAYNLLCNAAMVPYIMLGQPSTWCKCGLHGSVPGRNHSFLPHLRFLPPPPGSCVTQGSTCTCSLCRHSLAIWPYSPVGRQAGRRVANFTSWKMEEGTWAPPRMQHLSVSGQCFQVIY